MILVNEIPKDDYFEISKLTKSHIVVAERLDNGELFLLVQEYKGWYRYVSLDNPLYSGDSYSMTLDEPKYQDLHYRAGCFLDNPNWKVHVFSNYLNFVRFQYERLTGGE